jgi:hypothetical protein
LAKPCEHLTDPPGNCEKRVEFGFLQQANAATQNQVRFHFEQRTSRYSQMVQEFTGVIASLAFSDIRWNRSAGTPNLTDETE